MRRWVMLGLVGGLLTAGESAGGVDYRTDTYEALLARVASIKAGMADLTQSYGTAGAAMQDQPSLQREGGMTVPTTPPPWLDEEMTQHFASDFAMMTKDWEFYVMICQRTSANPIHHIRIALGMKHHLPGFIYEGGGSAGRVGVYTIQSALQMVAALEVLGPANRLGGAPNGGPRIAWGRKLQVPLLYGFVYRAVAEALQAQEPILVVPGFPPWIIYLYIDFAFGGMCTWPNGSQPLGFYSYLAEADHVPELGWGRGYLAVHSPYVGPGNLAAPYVAQLLSDQVRTVQPGAGLADSPQIAAQQVVRANVQHATWWGGAVTTTDPWVGGPLMVRGFSSGGADMLCGLLSAALTASAPQLQSTADYGGNAMMSSRPGYYALNSHITSMLFSSYLADPPLGYFGRIKYLWPGLDRVTPGHRITESTSADESSSGLGLDGYTESAELLVLRAKLLESHRWQMPDTGKSLMPRGPWTYVTNNPYNQGLPGGRLGPVSTQQGIHVAHAGAPLTEPSALIGGMENLAPYGNAHKHASEPILSFFYFPYVSCTNPCRGFQSPDAVKLQTQAYPNDDETSIFTRLIIRPQYISTDASNNTKQASTPRATAASETGELE